MSFGYGGVGCWTCENSKSFLSRFLSKVDMPFFKSQLNRIKTWSHNPMNVIIVHLSIELKITKETAKTFYYFGTPFYILLVMEQCSYFICWDTFVYYCSSTFFLYVCIKCLYICIKLRILNTLTASLQRSNTSQMSIQDMKLNYLMVWLQL